jgi:hypothetical protein
MENDCATAFGAMNPKRYLCIQAAAILGTAAINSSYGVAAYIAAQEEACQCCP